MDNATEDTRPFGERLPHMVTEPPGPNSRALAERLRQHETPAASTIAAGEIPVFWERACGANIVDVDGNCYVDITGGFFVATAGHGHPRIVRAIQEQAETLLHSMGSVNPNPRRVELAEKLAEVTPEGLEVSYIANTGGEAIDMAVKTARLYTGKHMVIAFQGGFHGKTLASLALTAGNYFREAWQPLLTGAVHAPYAYCYRCPFQLTYPECGVRCAEYLDHLLTYPSSGVADVAAVILEPVQGQGGVIVPPPEFLPRVAEICRQHGVLLILDEIITGFGRTGQLFGCEHGGVVPDFLVVAKGIASGFPVSAVITRREIAAVWKSEQHTSTFLGHPVGCAAALAGIQVIQEEGLVERSRTLGAWLKEELLTLMARHSLVGDVRALGLMATLELVTDRAAKTPAKEAAQCVVHAALRRGLMATLRGGPYGNCLRLAPPLTIIHEQLEFAVRVLDESLSEVEAV